MSWTFKPALPGGATFSGDMVYNSTNIEVPDTVVKYIDSVSIVVNGMYSISYTGFETVHYQINNKDQKNISIMFVGNMPKYMYDLLCRLAIAINGCGMPLQFKDTFVTGTSASAVTYTCRWENAGDFVDNNELVSGASMELITFEYVS